MGHFTTVSINGHFIYDCTVSTCGEIFLFREIIYKLCDICSGYKVTDHMVFLPSALGTWTVNLGLDWRLD